MRPTIGLYLMLSLISTSILAADPTSWFQVNGGRWTVDQTVASKMQTRIKDYVELQAKAQRRKLQPWSEYTFQYQGRLSKGVRYIYINAFCEVFDSEDIHANFIVVFDGGTCYFRLRFDPKTERFSQLIFNGVA